MVLNVKQCHDGDALRLDRDRKSQTGIFLEDQMTPKSRCPIPYSPRVYTVTPYMVCEAKTPI